MRILIVGGSKSGKSDYAQQVALKLADGGTHYYIATLIPTGCESDHATIQSHLDRRAGMGFETIEEGKHPLACLDYADKSATFLLDSVTTLLSNALYPAQNNYEADEAAAEACCEELISFIRRVSHAVVVSDDLFRDALRYDAHTDVFRRQLGRIHQRLAQECDVVLEMVFQSPILMKGEWI